MLTRDQPGGDTQHTVTGTPALTHLRAVAYGCLCPGGSFSLLEAKASQGHWGSAGEISGCCFVVNALKPSPIPQPVESTGWGGRALATAWLVHVPRIGFLAPGAVGGRRGAIGDAPASAGSLTLLSPSEPIQSRCAVLRYTKLSDAQVLARLLTVLEQEKVPYTDDGLEAVIFTAQGDMRQVRVVGAPRAPTSWVLCTSFWGESQEWPLLRGRGPRSLGPWAG